MSFVLKTISLSLGYKDITVLGDVNFEVQEGEFWFLVGPNGVGKTTLLRAILGELRPQFGKILLNPELARRDRIGFVPQRCDLNPTLPTTVREFVILGLVGLRSTRKDRAERLAWALEKLGLGGMEKKDYWSLSGGQRLRALVARALIRRPGLLILDEPTAGLDLPGKEGFLRSLGELNRQERLTLLFVTHDLTDAVRYASHVALCAGGRILPGPAEDVLSADNLEQTYGVPVRISMASSGGTHVWIEDAAREK